MADLPPYPDANDVGSDRVPTTSTPPITPRWVKAFGIIALALVLLFVVVTLAGGDHGPSRHMPSGGAGGQTPPSTVTVHGVQQP